MAKGTEHGKGSGLPVVSVEVPFSSSTVSLLYILSLEYVGIR